MSPAMLALIFSLVEEAIKVTPGLVTAFEEIFSNPNATPADWEALRAKVLANAYGDYVPQSDLSQEQPAPAPASDQADAAPAVSHIRADGTSVIVS